MDDRLATFLQHFDHWAATHPQLDDGWETWFPAFPDLVNAAVEAMMRAAPDDADQLKQIARVWSLSEETEDLAEAVKAAPTLYARILPTLIPHADWRARLQIYAIAPQIPGLGAPFLHQGLIENENPYVLRRILLALHEIDPEAAYQAAHQFVSSVDADLKHLGQTLTSRRSP